MNVKVSEVCFICAKFTVKEYQKVIDTDRIPKMYFEKFKKTMWNLGEDCSPTVICKICCNQLVNTMKIKSPAEWRKFRNHPTDCYFCRTSLKGFNHKPRDKVKYAKVFLV